MPISAAILFGLGLGGFFDSIMSYHAPQWHHMLSTLHPLTTLEALRLNTFWQGIPQGTTQVLPICVPDRPVVYNPVLHRSKPSRPFPRSRS